MRFVEDVIALLRPDAVLIENRTAAANGWIVVQQPAGYGVGDRSQLKDLCGHWIELVGRNNIAGKWIAYGLAIDQPRGSWIINLAIPHWPPQSVRSNYRS